MQTSNLATYPYTMDNLYTTVAFNMTGGNLLRWYRDNFGRYEVQQARQDGKDIYDLLTSSTALHGNPFDGHTLSTTIERSNSNTKIEAQENGGMSLTISWTNSFTRLLQVNARPNCFLETKIGNHHWAKTFPLLDSHRIKDTAIRINRNKILKTWLQCA